MYTNLSTARHALRLGLSAVLLTIGTPRLLTAQDPPPLTKIKGVTVTATPLPAGPNIMVGVVRDTAGVPIPGAEVIIPDLKLLLIANEEGLFRFEGVRHGKHAMRARKIGYAPQVREFALDSAGGVAEFALVPVTKALPPIVAWSDRPGITGLVGDTAFQPIAGAFVRLLGEGQHAETDSSGRFYFPAKGGTYQLSISKPGYDPKLVSVSYPADSGRRITTWLNDVTHAPDVFERQAFDSLRFRRAWVKPQDGKVFSHEQLEDLGSPWIYDAVQTTGSKFNYRELFDRDCYAIVNGGRGIANLAYLTVDEVESIEIYGSRSAPTAPSGRRSNVIAPTSMSGGTRGKIAMPGSQASAPMTARAAMANSTRNCPTIYVWLR
jgi:hypothetical protein